jgi:hypothetical protein
MAHHKRHRPKNARAGCLLCHWYKAGGTPPRLRLRPSDRRRLDAAEALEAPHDGANDDTVEEHRP